MKCVFSQNLLLFPFFRYQDELIITPVFKAHDFIHFMLVLYKPRPMAIRKEDKMASTPKSLGKTLFSEVINRYCRSPNRYILFKNFWNFVQNHVMFKNLWQNKKSASDTKLLSLENYHILFRKTTKIGCYKKGIFKICRLWKNTVNPQLLVDL